MPPHSSWKGHLKISLASIPVQAYTSSAGKDTSEIALHRLHKTCKSRIQYQKVCPIHGEVSKDEIVSGYEYAKGQYAIMEPDELAALGAVLEKSLNIEAFVTPDKIDPVFAAGQTYYLVPDGRVGDKPYAIIRESLFKDGLYGVGEIVISRKQRLVRLRATERLLIIDMLHYGGELRLAAAFDDEVRTVSVTANDLKLAHSLIDQMKQTHFDPDQYADDYMERMQELIKSKVKGKKITAPAAEEGPDVINFMDALKKSVKAVSKPGASSVSKKTAHPTHAARTLKAAPKKKARASKRA
ncbi:MAG: ykoV 2 [Planctomycetaceae bacterium]|nr:ykoV 2 [Planctomycetaceae bacterium]